MCEKVVRTWENMDNNDNLNCPFVKRTSKICSGLREMASARRTSASNTTAPLPTNTRHLHTHLREVCTICHKKIPPEMSARSTLCLCCFLRGDVVLLRALQQGTPRCKSCGRWVRKEGGWRGLWCAHEKIAKLVVCTNKEWEHVTVTIKTKDNIQNLSNVKNLHTYVVDELNRKGVQDHVNWFAGPIHHPVTSTSHVTRYTLHVTHTRHTSHAPTKG